MKLKHFFIAAIASATGLWACSTDNEDQSGTTAGEETFVGITVKVPVTNQTRAEDPFAASVEENAITEIGIYIVDDNSGHIHSAVLNVSNFNDVSDTYSQTSAAIKTTTGDKTIYAIANPTAGLISDIAAMRGAAFTTVLNRDDSYFLRTASSPQALTEMVMSGKSAAFVIQRNETEALEAANLFKIDVNRNLAKVVVKTRPGMTVHGGSSSDHKFALTAKALKAYMLPQTNTALYEVPLESSGDPTASYLANFSSLGSTTNTPTLTYIATCDENTAASVAKGWYAHEHKPEAYFIGNTTAAKIQGVFNPDETVVTVVSAYDATTGTRTVAADDASGITTGDSFRLLKDDGSYWTVAAFNAATANSSNPEYIAPEAFTAEYKDGVGYYTIYVQSADKVKEVVRNNYYELVINSISGPGSPTETYPGEEVNPVPDDTFLGIEFTVKSWDMQKSDHDIQ